MTYLINYCICWVPKLTWMSHVILVFLLFQFLFLNLYLNFFSKTLYSIWIHMGRGENVLKKLTNFWIHSMRFKPFKLKLIFYYRINPLFFLLWILSILTHTGGEGGEESLKETDSGVYIKWSNFWIHSTF